MSGPDSPNDLVTTQLDPVTTEVLLPRFGEDESPDQIGDLDWPTQQVRTGLRLRKSTAVLAGVLLLAGGFWGGTYLQKNEGGTSAASSTRSFAARAGFTRGGAAGGAGGAAAFGSAGSATSTVGTVTDIIGSALYVTTATGSLVKVSLSPSATVSRNAKSTLSALKPGDTVVVQGSKVSKGTMTASSVSATAAGVSSGFAGRGAGAGGASGASGTAAGGG
ncbi:MAG: hypothetical protein JWM85_1554 [Acidimicrobiaceae bacterium]|nr:hypothetical protein [Acidimicrobiaceae bacterium]